MLEGFDKEWNYVGENRSATYTNLDPGNYTFRVKTQKAEGIWSETERTLQIIINPPFWNTSWFKILSVLLAAGFILYILYRRDTASKRQKKSA